MARRRSGVSDFFDGFNQSYQTFNKVMQDRELRRIANETPEESQGYTADQGADLEAAAKRGDKVDIRYKDDGQGNQIFDRYVVTPKLTDGQMGPPQSRDVAMQGVTDFMGERRAGTMTDGQVDRARTMAQSGVLAKFGDPLGAQKLRQQAAQSEQMEKQGVLTDMQIGRARREEDVTKKLDEANNSVAEYMKSRVKLGPDGQPQPLTDEDFVMAGKQRVFELADRGLFDQAGTAAKESMDYATKKIQAETAERQVAVRDAVARAATGDFASVMAVFNKYVPDGNMLQAVTPNKDGSFTLERVSGVDGKKLPPVKVESLDKLVASVQTLADPNALTQYIDRTFRNDIETRRLKLTENADRRAGAAFAQGQADRAENQAEKVARADAAVAIFQERNPNASEAELNAVRRGILEPVPTADKNSPAEVKLAKAMVDAGLAPDMSAALERAMSTKSKPARDAYLEMMKPNSNGIVPSEAKVASVMEAAYGPNWRGAVAGKDPESGNSQGAAANPAPYPDGTELKGKDGKIYVVRNGVPVPK